MSLFALLSTAVAIPLAVVVAAFIGFYLYAQLVSLVRRFTGSKSPKSTRIKPQELSNTHLTDFSSITSVSPEGLNITTTPYALTSSGTTPSFLPISHFLGDTLTPAFGETAGFTYDLKDIPGINESIQSELLELGYTSVEQIARWGRADVRAVSALLEVDQNKIEEEWVAGARFILSIR